MKLEKIRDMRCGRSSSLKRDSGTISSSSPMRPPRASSHTKDQLKLTKHDPSKDRSIEVVDPMTLRDHSPLLSHTITNKEQIKGKLSSSADVRVSYNSGIIGGSELKTIKEHVGKRKKSSKRRKKT